jgi:hypothetical protein
MYNYGQTSINDPMIRQNAIQNLFMQLLSQDDETLNNLNSSLFPNPGPIQQPDPYGNQMPFRPAPSPTMPNIPRDPYAPYVEEQVQGTFGTRPPIYRNPYAPIPQVPRGTTTNIPRLMPTRADVVRFGGIF